MYNVLEGFLRKAALGVMDKGAKVSTVSEEEKETDSDEESAPEASPRKAGKHKCSVCGQAFSVAARLKRHFRSHSGERPYVCDVCGKDFTVKENLTVHMRSHTKEKPYVCGTCGRGFEHSGKLRRHEKIHSGQRPHVCKICGKGFIQSGQLTVHLRMHSGEKPFKCDTCEKAFACSKQLKVHIRTHSGERPYECPICKKTFAYSHVLKFHQVSHAAEKQYRCTSCQMVFEQRSDMNAHVRQCLTDAPSTSRTLEEQEDDPPKRDWSGEISCSGACDHSEGGCSGKSNYSGACDPTGGDCSRRGSNSGASNYSENDLSVNAISCHSTAGGLEVYVRPEHDDKSNIRMIPTETVQQPVIYSQNLRKKSEPQPSEEKTWQGSYDDQQSSYPDPLFIYKPMFMQSRSNQYGVSDSDVDSSQDVPQDLSKASSHRGSRSESELSISDCDGSDGFNRVHRSIPSVFHTMYPQTSSDLETVQSSVLPKLALTEHQSLPHQPTCLPSYSGVENTSEGVAYTRPVMISDSRVIPVRKSARKSGEFGTQSVPERDVKGPEQNSTRGESVIKYAGKINKY